MAFLGVAAALCPACGKPAAEHEPNQVCWFKTGERPIDIPPSPRSAAAVCAKAAELVGGDREKQHGAKQENFDNIAALWSAYLGVPITARQFAVLMVLLKVARAKTGEFNLDDYVDMAGYAGCAAEVER